VTDVMQVEWSRFVNATHGRLLVDLPDLAQQITDLLCVDGSVQQVVWSLDFNRNPMPAIPVSVRVKEVRAARRRDRWYMVVVTDKAEHWVDAQSWMNGYHVSVPDGRVQFWDSAAKLVWLFYIH
jgi:hypothetical protein